MSDENAAADATLRARVAAGLADAPILIVDDAPVNCELVSSFLQIAGFRNIRTAGDGVAALEAIKTRPPDVVVTDLAMPRMDGFELCRALRARPEHADTPIIVQTGLDDPRQRARVFALGATDLVMKPVNRFELTARVVNHTARAALIRDLSAFRTRLQADLAIAREMQLRALPSDDVIASYRDGGLEIAHYYESSDELGGDFWGLRRSAEGLCGVFIFDFSGHGVTAALNTFRAQALIDETWPLIDEPDQFLKALNSTLSRLLDVGQFATMLAGVVDRSRGVFRYASAGAPSPMLMGTDGVARLLPSDGLPLGVTADAEHEARETPFVVGDTIGLYSDAFTEAPMLEGGHLGEDAFRADLETALRRPTCVEAVSTLFDARKTRGVAPFDDDATLVCLRALPV